MKNCVDNSDYYRNNPRNVPHALDGSVIQGGPWLRAGETDSSKDGISDSNNGKVAFASIEADCPEGKAAVFVGPSTSLNHSILIKAGIKGGSLGVPLSNGQHPPFAHDFKDEIYKIGQYERQGGMSNFTKVTGAKFTVKGSDKSQSVPKVTDSKLLGTFNISRTGLLAVVDLEGEQYITRDSEHLRNVLAANGFHRAHTLEVPFAKGEKPVLPPNYLSDTPEYVVSKMQDSNLYKRGLQTIGISAT